jgi:hypothetical protein
VWVVVKLRTGKAQTRDLSLTWASLLELPGIESGTEIALNCENA